MKSLKESFIKAKDLDNLNKRKYILTDETLDWNGHILYRIRALKNIPSIKVKNGDLGGWVESYNNLDQEGNCWVRDEAKVYDDAKVYGNAQILHNTEVYGKAQVYGLSIVCNNAKVYGDAEVCGWATVYGSAEVYGDAELRGSARINYNINSGTK